MPSRGCLQHSTKRREGASWCSQVVRWILGRRLVHLWFDSQLQLQRLRPCNSPFFFGFFFDFVFFVVSFSVVVFFVFTADDSQIYFLLLRLCAFALASCTGFANLFGTGFVVLWFWMIWFFFDSDS